MKKKKGMCGFNFVKKIKKQYTILNHKKNVAKRKIEHNHAGMQWRISQTEKIK